MQCSGLSLASFWFGTEGTAARKHLKRLELDFRAGWSSVLEHVAVIM